MSIENPPNILEYGIPAVSDRLGNVYCLSVRSDVYAIWQVACKHLETEISSHVASEERILELVEAMRLGFYDFTLPTNVNPKNFGDLKVFFEGSEVLKQSFDLCKVGDQIGLFIPLPRMERPPTWWMKSN